MKKYLFSFIAAVLLVLSCTPVQAAFDKPIKMYVTKDDVSVYKEAKKESDVVYTLNASDEVMATDITKNEKWYAVTYTNKKGKEKNGWIQAKYLSDTLDPSFCKHDWSKWKVSREPTCSRKGVKKRTCKRCGIEETKAIDKLDHTFGKWKTTKEATCTKEGEETRTCKVCEYEETRKIKKLPHEFGKWEVTKEATCTEEGEETRTCKVCKEKETRAIKKTAHEFGKWEVTREATCTKEGEETRTCKVCKEKETRKIEKLPHEFKDWVVTKKATCTRKGEKTRECKNCDYEETQEIAMLPHEFTNWDITAQATDHSSGMRTRYCKVCELKQERSYDPKGTLRRGASGAAVQEIQQLLIDQKYLSEGGADGVFGGGTEKAIAKFQADQGFVSDGVAWPQTIKRLRHKFGKWTVVQAPSRSSDGERTRVCKTCGFEEHEYFSAGQILVRGDRSEEVRTVQMILDELKYPVGKADGIYGPKLDEAFRTFASDHGTGFAGGKIRPADTDALVHGWLDSLPGGGIPDSPDEDLLLTVTPSEETDGVPEGWLAFNWRLTNLGDEPLRMEMLLLGYGFAPDYTNDSLVMTIGGDRMAAYDEEDDEEEEGAKNTLSGTFCIDPAWGEGDLNFYAIAASQNNGAERFSNVVTRTVAEEETEAEEVTEAAGSDTEVEIIEPDEETDED